jgi:hypothetical protein
MRNFRVSTANLWEMLIFVIQSDLNGICILQTDLLQDVLI